MQNLHKLVERVYGEERLFTQVLEGRVHTALTTLTPRERFVLALRYGLCTGKARTFKEVGKSFGISMERIRQIDMKAIRKLRHSSRLGGGNPSCVGWMELPQLPTIPPIQYFCRGCGSVIDVSYPPTRTQLVHEAMKEFRDLSTRTKNCLIKYGYYSRRQVARVEEEALLTVHHLGTKGVTEISEWLKKEITDDTLD